jgi:hypothetical protein
MGSNRKHRDHAIGRDRHPLDANRVATHPPSPYQLSEVGMTNLEELERLINSSKLPGAPVSGATVLALIVEVRALRADAARYCYLRSINRRACLDAEGPAAGCWIDCEGEDGALYLLTEEDADSYIDSEISKGSA